MTKADKEGQRKTPVLRFKGFTDDWEQRKLGDVVKFFDNFRKPLKSSDRKKGIYPYYGATGIIDYINDYIFDGEYVLLSEDGANIIDRNYPVSFITEGKFWVNNHAHIMRSDNNSNYFISLLLEKINYIKYNSGSAQPKLTSKNVKKIILFIPSKLEQKQLSDFILKLSNLITLYERKLKLLSQVKKYFLDNLFAEKEYPNLRFKGFTDAWEKIKLKDTQTTLTDGNYANLYPKPADMTDADKGIPFLTGGNLKNGILDLENAKYITKEKHSQLKSGHLEEDDIVIAVRGSLGELGYVTKQNIDWNINSQLAIIRTSKNELIGKFLLYFFLSSKGKSKLLSRQTGTALKQLPLQQLKTIVVPKTLLLEQQKISNILKTIDKTISFYKGKQQHFAEIKNTLLNTMFI